MADYQAERQDPDLPACLPAQSTCDPTTTCCTPISLEFNGRTFIMRASDIYIYPAWSGRPLGDNSFDYSRGRQMISRTGPIPEGTYWIRPDQLWQNAWYKFRTPRSSWGNYRITIHPFTTSDTFGRGGFFIHGGSSPGSAGCIDLTGSMDRFVADLQKELAGRSVCQIHLRVDYR